LSILQDGTHGDGEESSFLAEKRLIAGRSCARRQMKKKLAPTSSEKYDPDSSRYPFFPSISDSNNITLQDKQKSVGKSSYAIAATFATAGLYHDAHPFAEEAKEEELEDATI
jgi:hypothetical protein